ncbi:hypothetical protein Tco_0082916, partial [Tanacetum coccineum]
GRPKPTERVIHPAGWSKRPAPVSAGRPVSAGWLNPAAIYDPMNKGRWGTAVKTSAGSSQNWLGSLKCTNLVCCMICRVVSASSSRSIPADCVPAGHVIISADRYREYADLSYRRN